MAVFDIRGRRVGIVAAILDDCFEVQREPVEGGPIHLTPDAIFTVEPRDGVSIVCEKSEGERYRCAAHTEAASS